jgi:hypothetical protein
MSREPATHFHAIDPSEMILSLMADGRERTVGDVTNRLKLETPVAQAFLTRLTKAKALSVHYFGDRGKTISIYKAAQ